MAVIRLDTHIRTTDRRIGKATALLNAVKKDPSVTFILTTRCDLTCQHCYVSRPERPVDLDLDLARDTAEELRGLPRLYFSGGEPLLYRVGEKGHEQTFLDLAHHVAERVGHLYIDTNGMFLPQDLAAAIAFLKQFPRNTAFMISLDQYHAEAAALRGRSLKTIFGTLVEACAANGLKLEINTRIPRTAIDFDGRNYPDKSRALNELKEAFGIPKSLIHSIHINIIFSQGQARQLPVVDTKPVSLNDFIKHVLTIGSIGLFITPQGLVVSGDHAAFLPSPPAFTILGDLHDHTMAWILWEKVVAGYARANRINFNSGYFLSSAYLLPHSDVILPFAPEHLVLIRDHLQKDPPSRDALIAEAVKFVKEAPQSMDWKIDLESDRILANFGEEEISSMFRQTAEGLIDYFLRTKPGVSSPYPFLGYSLRRGKPSGEVVPYPSHEPSPYGPSPYSFRLFLGNFHWLPEHDKKTGHLLNALFEIARERLPQTYDPDDFQYLRVLLEELAQRLSKRMDKLIPIIRSEHLPCAWEIEPRDPGINPPSFGNLNRALLDSYDELPLQLVKQAARDLIADLEQGRIDWRNTRCILYKFVIRKGALFFESEFFTGRAPWTTDEEHFDRLMSYTQHFFGGRWRRYASRPFVEALLAALAEHPNLPYPQIAEERLAGALEDITREEAYGVHGY